MSPIRRSFLFSAGALALVAMALAGCSAPPEAIPPQPSGSVSLGGGTELPDVDETIRAMLPESTRSSGVITAATDPVHPPYEFTGADNKQIVGMIPELGEAIGAVLGVEIELHPTAFAGIIAAVQTGRYDMSMLSMFDTPERQQQLDFVNFLVEGQRLIVYKGNPQDIRGLADLCGRTVSTLQGSLMLNLLEEYQPECDTPMDIAVAQSTADQLLQLQTRRAEATLANGSVTQFMIEHEGAEQLEVLTDEMFAPGYMGFGFTKDNTQLRDAVQAALQQLMDSGVYQAILDEWSISKDNVITEATINMGGTL